MSLRLRLIVAFFLLSVVPLGAVTFFTYLSNASAMRDAAGREAEVLAGELTERMTLVTAQISQHFEQLIDIPAQSTPTASSQASATRRPNSATSPSPEAEQATRVAERLGEVAILLNNIEVRGFGRGRGGFGRVGPGEVAAAGVSATAPLNPDAAAAARAGRRGRGGLPPDVAAVSPERSTDTGAAQAPPGEAALAGGEPGPIAGRSESAPGDVTRGRSDEEGRRGGRGGFDGAQGRRRDDVAGREGGGLGVDGRPGEPAGEQGHLQIDLGPMRREILQQIFPERERWDQLSPQERELILAKVNERMLGIQQGIQIVQQRAKEQVADAMTAVTRTTGEPSPVAGEDKARPEPAPAAPSPETGAPPVVETPVTTQAPSPVSPLQRSTAFSGSRMDVRVTRNGEVVGQVNAEVDLPNLLATVFTKTRREKGEVPFAVDRNGRIYTPTDADRAVITGLDSTASSPATAPGTVLLPNWVVVTAADPTGSELKFGIARPLGDALDDLRRSSARDAALGLGLIGLALIGIVPLSVRLTSNLSRLSEAVNQISRGDYRARVDVRSNDEFGRLATAFNHMAADVERHQQSAVEQERLRRELELGRQIQHDMLPQGPFRLGLTEIRGISVPATEVGGDFFNYFQTPSGKIALVVGDVSGKGVGAALLMANIQASLRTRLSMGQDLASLARELDADIGASTPGAVYATLFVGLLDPEPRTLDYVNAGHNPQFVLRAGGGSERMEATGLPIGLLVGHGYIEHRVELAQGDTLFFYTDGCVEAENGSGEMFGNTRLETLLARRPAGSPDDMLLRIEQEIVRFRSGREPFDDATLMVVSVG